MTVPTVVLGVDYGLVLVIQGGWSDNQGIPIRRGVAVVVSMLCKMPRADVASLTRYCKEVIIIGRIDACSDINIYDFTINLLTMNELNVIKIIDGESGRSDSIWQMRFWQQTSSL